MVNASAYDILIRMLTEDEGGGFMAIVPDLPGCMSDGETQEEAIANVRDAIDCWVEARLAQKRDVPHPGHMRALAGKWHKEFTEAVRRRDELEKIVDDMRRLVEQLKSQLETEAAPKSRYALMEEWFLLRGDAEDDCLPVRMPAGVLGAFYKHT